MSTGDHHGRKMTFVLFINGRPVDCGPLRRALEATYALVLPKAQKPWIYLVYGDCVCVCVLVGVNYNESCTVLLYIHLVLCIHSSSLALLLHVTTSPYTNIPTQDITLPRHHVDVNLHPTKSEVGFLHTDAILCVLREHVEKQLGSADTQRTFTQTLLPGAPAVGLEAMLRLCVEHVCCLHNVAFFHVSLPSSPHH